MKKLELLIIVGFLAVGCGENGSNSGETPVDTDTGYLPDTDDEGDVDTSFDTDPTDIPDIDFRMPCYDYQLFNYNNWMGVGGEAFAINDSDLAVGRTENIAYGANPKALYLPFRFQHFNSCSYTERHTGTVFSGGYFHDRGLPAYDLLNLHVVDVNNSGWMAGHGHHDENEEPDYLHAGYMDPEGAFQRLFSDETQSVAAAINDAGQIVGYLYNSYFDYSSGEPVLVEESQGFLWHDDVTPPSYLNPLPGAAADAPVVVHDVNNAGQVVGGAVDADGLWQAFVWEESSGYIPLETLGGGEAKAHGVNEARVVVGESLDDAGVWKPVVWDENGFITDLGLLDTEAMKSGVAKAVNEHGSVVGWDEPVSAVSYNRAWVWKDGVKTDLTATNNPHNRHHLATAHNINNNGIIVGHAMHYTNGPYAIALIPQDCGTTPDTDSGN